MYQVYLRYFINNLTQRAIGDKSRLLEKFLQLQLISMATYVELFPVDQNSCDEFSYSGILDFFFTTKSKMVQLELRKNIYYKRSLVAKFVHIN